MITHTHKDPKRKSGAVSTGPAIHACLQGRSRRYGGRVSLSGVPGGRVSLSGVPDAQAVYPCVARVGTRDSRPICAHVQVNGCFICRADWCLVCSAQTPSRRTQSRSTGLMLPHSRATEQQSALKFLRLDLSAPSPCRREEQVRMYRQPRWCKQGTGVL